MNNSHNHNMLGVGTYSGQLKQDFLLSAESRRIGTLTLVLRRKTKTTGGHFCQKKLFLPKQGSF